MTITKELAGNQALLSHALCFDPINQQQIPGGDFRLHFREFATVPGIRILEDGGVEVTFYAPGAKTVQIQGLGGSFEGIYDLEPVETMTGYWRATLTGLMSGFHYHWYLVDGVKTFHPTIPFRGDRQGEELLGLYAAGLYGGYGKKISGILSAAWRWRERDGVDLAGKNQLYPGQPDRSE